MNPSYKRYTYFKPNGKEVKTNVWFFPTVMPKFTLVKESGYILSNHRGTTWAEIEPHEQHLFPARILTLALLLK